MGGEETCSGERAIVVAVDGWVRENWVVGGRGFVITVRCVGRRAKGCWKVDVGGSS